MSSYQLKIRQVVDYPRCRIYRQFIQTLMADRNIRTDGGFGLYYYTALCSYANFRTSYRHIEGIRYTVFPGEWVCTLKELSGWFRARLQKQAIAILDTLQERCLIEYTLLGCGKVIKYKILDWKRHNTVLDYNCPCQKDTGFFFLPVSTAMELVSSGRCPEMDALLDLWLSTVYKDEQIQGSDVGPVVYLRNGTGSPLTGSAELAQRWSVSKATAWRMLKKLDGLGYISLLSFPGRKGSVIYLQNYLSTMFQISDVPVDKEEVAMALEIELALPDEEEVTTALEIPLTLPDGEDNAADTGGAIVGFADDNTSSSEPPRKIQIQKGFSCVSKQQAQIILAKMAETLVPQGFSCFQCRKALFKLYPLSDCKEEAYRGCSSLGLSVSCGRTRPVYAFEIALFPVENMKNGGFCHAQTAEKS